MLISQICRERDFREPWFVQCCDKLHEPFKYHRKLWEYCYIYYALHERGLLSPGKKGLGFAVGKEPLASAFASHGCEITATDLDDQKEEAKEWITTGQHSNNISDLNIRGICPPNAFEQLVSFEFADMNSISSKYYNSFDFTWSSCSFEHLGSIALGQRFVIEQMKCLRPGGIAVHTTEYNLSSNRNTIDNDIRYVLFRRRDIEYITKKVRKSGHLIEIDYTIECGELESNIDTDPFRGEHHVRPHIRLMLSKYIVTSIGLIIQKGVRKRRILWS